MRFHRLARCLQSVVLAHEGVLAPVFMSIEEYLGRNTDDYYAVLAAVGGGRWQSERDARPWARFILTRRPLSMLPWECACVGPPIGPERRQVR